MYVVAGLVSEVEEDVCFGIAVVVEEDCRIGDWILSRVAVVVDVEGLIAWAAVERRGFELPASIGLGSASARGFWTEGGIPVLALRV